MCFDYVVLWLSQERPIPPEDFARWVAKKVSLLAARQAELSKEPPKCLDDRLLPTPAEEYHEEGD